MNSFLNIQVRIIAAQAQRQLAQLQRQIGSLSFGSANASGGMFGRTLGNMRLDRFGSQMQWLGRQIEFNFTVPLLLAGTAATRMALENEAAFTRITKVYGDATHGSEFYRAELGSLQKAFVALSNQFGIAQVDTLNIAADWAAAGASGLALAKSVELTMKTMVLGELDAATATQSLIAIQAQYGQSISELVDTVDILNMVENQTGISMKGLIEGFTRSAGVARASGVSVRELAADLAALTPATGSAANAGNALKTIFSRLLSPTKDTAEVLGLMGINTRSFAFQSSNAQEKLLLMAKSFEKLSDAQKGLVSSIIASRYQVNRFEILMQELTSSTGYYARALQSTSDMSQVYAQAQRELNQVLTSNPQRLKVIWTMLQNAMANIIQPLIPLVLWLATALENMVTGFSHLNPSIQKFILFALVALAAIGPLVRYIGAFQVLIFELAGMFKLLLIPLAGIIGLFRILVILPVTQIFGLITIAARGMLVATAAVAAALPAVFSVAMSAVSVIISAGGAVWRFLYTAVMFSLGSGTILAWNIIIGIWGKMVDLIGPIITTGMAAARAAWAAGLASLQAMLIAFAGFSGRMWRLITTAPLLFMRGMWVAILSGFTQILPALRAAGIAISVALSGPWGIAITAIVLLILVFWKQIKQVWANAVGWFRSNGGGIASAFKPIADAAHAVRNVVIRAFNALPEGIRNAMLAVVRIISAAAKAVYQWFSYLNPWARHSPSLVENVSSGVAEIRRQYGLLTGVGSSFSTAARDLDAFAAAVRQVERAADNKKYGEIRKDLASMASGALPAFDRLIKELYILEDQLKAVQKPLEAQQAVVDDLKQHLDDANDALSTQKDILQAMKDEADGYQEKINQINGDLEVLTGTREALRQAGAGSDILGGMDSQIKMLRDQKKGVNDQLDAAKKAYDSQKKLIDDLTKARDKLQASYDEEVKKLKAIQDAYDKIQQRIQDITGAINDFKSAVDQMKAGKEDDLSKNFAAGAGANFPDVGGGGVLGHEGGIEDQSAMIDQFTQELQNKTKNLFGLFNFLEPLKKGWNKAIAWLKTTFGPIGHEVGDFFSHLFDNVPNPFKGLDFGGFTSNLKNVFDDISGWLKDLWNLVGPPIKEIGKVIQGALGDALKQIGPELAKFKDLVKPLGDLFKEIWTVLKPVAALIGGILLLAILIFVNVLKNTLGPVLHWAIDIIKAVIQILRGLIEFIVGVFTGNWSLAWKGIKDVFGGIWDAIWSTLKNVVLLLWGVVKGLVEGIVSFFSWLYDKLIGHSIIPDLVNGILDWFKSLGKFLLDIWNAMMKGLEWIWNNILKPVFDNIKAGWNYVVAGIKLGIDAANYYWNLFKSYLQNLWSFVSQVIGWIRDKFWDIVNGISNAINTARGWIDIFVGALLGIKNRISSAFWGIFDGLKSAFQSAVNWIIGKWNNLSFGVGPFKMDTPNIPYLAQGGLVANQAMAIVGEGRKGYPEYVIPTDPQYRKRALQLFEALGNELGFNHLVGSAGILHTLAHQLTRGVAGDKIQFFASGGILGGGSIRTSGRGGVLIAAHSDNRTVHFHGDLTFPNVRNSHDAEQFIENLAALIGS